MDAATISHFVLSNAACCQHVVSSFQRTTRVCWWVRPGLDVSHSGSPQQANSKLSWGHSSIQRRCSYAGLDQVQLLWSLSTPRPD